MAPRRMLVHNPRKQSYTVLVERPQGPLSVVKWHGPSAPANVQEAFKVERRAYERRLFSLSPQLLDASDDCLVIEWVGGASVRQALWTRLDTPTQGEVPGLISDAAAAIVRMHSVRTNGGSGSIADLLVCLRPILFSLAASGPITTSRPRWESAMTRILSRVARPILEARVARLGDGAPGLFARGPAHGDLHLDNVVVAGDGSIRVVDLANSRDLGFPLLDVVYALAAGLASVAHDRVLRERSRSLSEARIAEIEPDSASAIVDVASQLANLGAINSRFNPRGRLRARQAAYLWHAARAATSPVR